MNWKTKHYLIPTFRVGHNPSTITETHGVPDDTWQTGVSDPAFSWSGASDSDSGVAGYHLYWGQEPQGITPTTFITGSGYDPLPVGGPGKYYLRVQTEDGAGNRAAGWAGFTFRYGDDQAGPVLSALTLTATEDPALHVALARPTLYYNQNPAANSTLTVTLVATDTPAGLQAATFPAVFGGDGDTQTLSGPGPLPLTQTYTVDAAQAVSDTFAVVVTDTDANASGVTFGVRRDTVAPTVAITVPVQTGADIPVVWSGVDDGAGLRSYEVQVKEDSDSWGPWLTGTTATQETYVGTPGHTYTFRLKATDRVNNTTAEWVESGVVEIGGGAVTKYYYFNGQRIAMRQGGEVYYLSGDHLGSVSLTTGSTGTVVAERRYLPYGQMRWQNDPPVTDFGFTGQRNEGFGLMDYKARYYDPYLGRFISADTIVPEPGNPQGFNRYSYTLNNPLRYTDPSGHFIFEEEPNDFNVVYREDEAVRSQYWNSLMDVPPATTGDLVAPVAAIYGPPIVMAMVTTVTAAFVVNGTIGMAGYTGSVYVENCLGTGCSFEGWNGDDGIASFLTGGMTSIVPGEGNIANFVRGAIQNGGAYALGQWFNGETPDPGITAANGASGGFASILGEQLTKVIPAQATFAAALARTVSPILTSSGVVGSQNAAINELSEITESVQPFIQDLMGTYTEVWKSFHMAPHGIP